MDKDDREKTLEYLANEHKQLKYEYNSLLLLASKFDELKEIRIKLRKIEDEINILKQT